MSAPLLTSPSRRCAPRLPLGIMGRGAIMAGMLLGLMGCSDFPEPIQALTEAELSEGFPALVPAEALLAGTQDQAIGAQTQTSLEDRRTALERRAAALRAMGLDPATRDRMQAGVTGQQP